MKPTSELFSAFSLKRYFCCLQKEFCVFSDDTTGDKMRTLPNLSVFFCIALSGLIPAQAAVEEIQNLRAESRLSWAWDVDPDSLAYHMYRGDLAGLPDNGTCLLGSIPGQSASDDEVPPPGSGWFYLASSFDTDTEGTLGSDSGATPRSVATACTPSRRSFSVVPNGAAADGLADGLEPRRNASSSSWSRSRETVGVYMHTGEFFLNAVDLQIPGRGLDWSFSRKYRSQIQYDGPLGHGWDFNMNARLIAVGGGDHLFLDGTGRQLSLVSKGDPYPEFIT